MNALRWLIWLRWCGVAGQSVTVLAVDWGLGIDLPLVALFGFIGVTALSNLAATLGCRTRAPAEAGSDWLAGALVATDVVVLTALLLFTGGPGNPFASFYLVHATMAAMVLPARGAWLIWALCSAGYALLFLLRQQLSQLHPHAICGPAMDYELHLRGMLVALVLTAAAIAYFVGRMMRALGDRERELRQAREREVESQHFASLATLAAGVAHEIGSPLGTIAVAAGELKRAASEFGPGNTLREDAELIAEEVVRCRSILDRLNDRSGAMGDLPRRVAADDLIRGVCEGLPAGQAARLRYTNDGIPLTFLAPPLALTQALGVLVKNAFDASPGAATVEVRVQPGSGAVRFVVADSGIGLSDEARAHAGEPFFTTKEPGRGMGLGLFLVRLLARRLNGSFSLEPIPSGGTKAVLIIGQAPTP